MPYMPLGPLPRRLHRRNVATLSSFVLILILSAMLILGVRHVLEQDRRQLTADFATRINEISEQERFLQQLHEHNARLNQVPAPPPADAVLPFDYITGRDGTGGTEAHNAIGAYLAAQYSAFWAFSYYPAPHLLVFNENDGSALLVRRSETRDAGGALNQPWLQQATTLALREGRVLRPQISPPTQSATASAAVHWFAVPEHPDRMLGLAHAGFPAKRVPGITEDASQIYMGVLSALPPDGAAPAYQFWLQQGTHAPVLGQGSTPDVQGSGLHLTAQGLILRLTSPQGTWRGTYRIGYANFVQDNPWLLAIAAALVLLGIVASVGYVRWYRQRVIEPARHAQEALVESEMFNRTLIATAPVALCLLERPNGSVVFATALAKQWLGLEASQPAPQSLASKLDLHQLLDARAPGTVEKVELAQGRSLHVSYAPTRYHQKDVVLFAFTDVTAQAEMQRELERARIAADEASAAKSTFLATMSHEIRTPLYALLGTLELHALTPLDSQQSRHVERMQDASEQLLQQINDVLDISKIEAGQMRLELRPFSPRVVVERCTSDFSAMAHQRGLLLFCTIDPSVPDQVVGDALRLRQILSNLIANAIKFTHSGHVIVRLKHSPQGEAPSMLRFEVIDSGVGIAPENIERLFNSFYVVEQSHNTIRGTGLGLSICKRLADLMGGTLTVESQVSSGSTFRLDVTLPPAPRPAESPLPPRLQGIRLSLRSPHQALSEHIAQWLTLWGATIEILAENDLPHGRNDGLLDVQMPTADAPDGWDGTYISIAPRSTAASHLDVDACSVESIAYAVLGTTQHQTTGIETSEAFGDLGMTVLVAEDNPINQATLKEQLVTLGCRIVMTQDGQEALARTRDQTFDLILTDINMMDMSGYELAATLRERGNTGPIIGLTANAMHDEEEKCLRSGMNGLLLKPVTLKGLFDVLERWKPQDALLKSINAEAASELEDPWVSQAFRDVFRTTMFKDIEVLRQKIADNDLKGAQQRLHRMRGALIVVGDAELELRLEEIEHRLLLGTWNPETREQLISLCRTLDLIVDAV